MPLRGNRIIAGRSVIFKVPSWYLQGEVEEVNKQISYGERGRIGLLYPSSGWVMEPELYAMAPEGVITVTTRLKLETVTAEGVQKLADQIVDATELLTDARADVIVLGCTSGSFILGSGYDQTIIRRIEQAAPGIKASTTATAVVHALQALGVKKVAVGTPYIDEINERAERFLTDEGFAVVSFHGLGLADDDVINALSRDEIRALIRAADCPDAEAVCLLCTSIKGVDILEEMERELGKPVITAIQATFMESLRLLGISPSEVKGYGSLFSRAAAQKEG